MNLIQNGPSEKFDPIIKKLNDSLLECVEVYVENGKEELHIDAKNGHHILIFQERGWYDITVGPSLYSYSGVGGNTKMLTSDSALRMINLISNIGR
jgi:hypothetical protein